MIKEQGNTIVSIIIPVFNQEELIVRCLDSIPKRDDIEVIVIDDGSTDNTLEVVQKYDRIPLIVLHQENSGPGIARALGFATANGKWIYGIDSDDYLYTDVFNKTVDTLDDNYDIIYIARRENSGKVVTGGTIALWTKFIKRDFLGDIKSDDSIADDWFVFLALKEKHPKEKFLTDVVYHYNYPREGSIMWRKEHGVQGF